MASAVPVGPARRLLRAVSLRLPRLGRDRLLRWLDSPDRLTERRFCVPFRGLRYEGSLSSFIDWSVFYHGAFAGHELDLLEAIAGRLGAVAADGVQAWDIGANVGQHTMVLASCCAGVTAFEPLAENVAQIHAQLAGNDLANVTVLALALGERDEPGCLHYPDPRRHANGGTASLRPDYDAANDLRRAVQVRRGDALVAERGLPLPDLIKLDVEGSEVAVLASLEQTLGRAHPVILMETNPHTWRDLTERGGLRFLGNDARFFALDAERWRGRYRLTPLDAGACCGDIEAVLVVPASRLPALGGLLPGTV